MPFIGAPSPKDLEIYETLETISDRKTYTGDGSKRVFGVSYFDNHISVFQNGLKLVEGIDYNLASSGQYITFTIAPENGDLIDLIGTVGVTNLSQSSYIRETFVSVANQTSITLSTDIDPLKKLNVYYNGIRLSETDYTIVYANNTVSFSQPALADDLIAVDIFAAGYRMIDGTLDVTNLTQTSYAREAFENLEGANSVILSTTIDSSYRTNIYLNGLRLFPDVDYQANYTNNSIEFTQTFANTDVLEIDLYSAGFRILENIDTQITNFSQSSYIKETFVASANQSNVVLSTDVTSYFKINPYVNGVRLSDSDFSVNHTINTISFVGFTLSANDDVVIDMYRPGYRVQGFRLQDIDMPEGTVGQVLTTDGAGNFYFANTTQSLTNLNIQDGTAGQVLKTYGNNTFYFADEENLNAILYSIALG